MTEEEPEPSASGVAPDAVVVDVCKSDGTNALGMARGFDDDAATEPTPWPTPIATSGTRRAAP